MVYTTCSLNPVENEAVVAQVLKAAGGAARLVSALPGTVRDLCWEAGLSTWKVMHGHKWRSRDIEDSKSPPLASSASPVDLQACMRFLPHRHRSQRSLLCGDH